VVSVHIFEPALLSTKIACWKSPLFDAPERESPECCRRRGGFEDECERDAIIRDEHVIEERTGTSDDISHSELLLLKLSRIKRKNGESPENAHGVRPTL
jgi:hypothetical protein